MKSKIDLNDDEDIETELETRKRIIQNYLTKRSNCIVLKLDKGIRHDLSPFGFHFELDKRKYIRKIKEKKRKKLTKWFHWAAVIHHRLGIRHVILIGVLILYTICGGIMFNAIESNYEKQNLMKMIVNLDDMMKELTNKTINVANSNSTSDLKYQEIFVLITDYYKSMLQYEDRYSGSVFHKMENLDLHRTWNFGSAIFYSMTLFTTIGYGTISCNTVVGQALSLIYSTIGIPLMLVVLGDVGNLLLKMFTNIYGFLLYSKRKLFTRTTVKYIEEFDEDEEIELPTIATIIIICLYLLICAAIVHFFDWTEGHREGISMWDSFYFSTISFFTIGLGDVMPNNILYSPFIALLFLIGLSLVSMINSSFYTKMENSFFSFMNLLEHQLETIHREHYSHGYKSFIHLSEVFKIVVYAIPKIPDVIEYEYDYKGNRSLGIQVDLISLESKNDEEKKQPKKRKNANIFRVQSDTKSRPKIIQTKRERAPTLGVLNMSTEPVILKAGNLMGGLFVPNIKKWKSGDV